MQVTEVNDIKTYNLSHGKTIPEWLSDRKKRLLLRKDVDLRRRIQLIQDFDMPTVSNTVNISPDGQYIIATGIYKPRVRCYDVNQLALKFERGLDAAVIKCIVLSDDYSKLLFLEEDRYVELHSQFGFYYKTRIPKFGRDMAYNYATCDAYFVGTSHEIFRLNLEVGTYLKPFETNTVSLNSIAINPVHNLLVVGSQEGYIEAWDPRVRERVGTLDCAYDVVRSEANHASRQIPAVSTISFRDGLTMGVGTASGQILLYDIRAKKPYLTKDHMFGMPIKTIAYLDGPLDLIASVDAKIIKFWNRNNGSPYTAIQSDSDLNMLTAYPNSGMFFVANESEKILSYYIPSIGPAPKWCSFLDRITEELEESNENAIYDDYKFITEPELEEIGLADLIGTNLLRAYMHGFFMDMRLYKKARDASQPFAYEEYKKQKIRQKIESERVDRVSIQDKLPKVNRSLAERLLLDEEEREKKKNKKYTPNPLKDDRFSSIFTNPDFQIDELSEEFRLLNPVLNRMAKPDSKSDSKPIYADVFEEDRISTDSDGDLIGDGADDSLSDDDHQEEESADEEDAPAPGRVEKSEESLRRPTQQSAPGKTTKPANRTKVFRMKEGKTFEDFHRPAGEKVASRKVANVEKQTFEQRLKLEQINSDGESLKLLHGGIGGNRVMSFVPKASGREKEQQERSEAQQNKLKDHLTERKKLARKAKGLKFSRKTIG